MGCPSSVVVDPRPIASAVDDDVPYFVATALVARLYPTTCPHCGRAGEMVPDFDVFDAWECGWCRRSCVPNA